MRTFQSIVLLTAIAGCTPDAVSLNDARFATGSRTMVSDVNAERLFALNVDEGTLSRVDLASGSIDKIDIGEDPTRVARAGDLYFVTLRGERAIAVFRDGKTGLDRLDPIQVGCEPYGIVATEDGSRIFVTLSQENRTIAIDVETREITHSWDTPGDPRWLALNPSGELLIVAPARGGIVYTVETGQSGEEAVEVVTMPITERTTSGGRIELTPRIMGDMAFNPAGTKLVIPALYVDIVSQEDLPANVDPTTAYYVNPLPGIGRFNSAVIEIPVTAGGRVKEQRAQAIFLASFTDGASETIRSYPNSITVSPDGLYYAVSLEGSDAVVMLGALAYDGDAIHDLFVSPGKEVDATKHGFTERPHATVQFPRGSAPRGVVYTSDADALVHNFMSLKVTPIPTSAQDKVRDRGNHGIDDFDGYSANLLTSFVIERTILPRDIRAGRKLFFSATNPDLVAFNAGVSCHTCHLDGRDDGLTWQLGPDVWQTPSLAGRVSDTHPVTWSKQIETVAAEAAETSRIRMGGGHLSAEEYALMAAYVDWTALPDTPTRGLDTPLVRQGQVIFERADVGCAECHSGVAYTDNEHYEMYNLQSVNTPPLRGVSATGPYLHDGRAETIRDVLELSRARVMGDTSMLSNAEMDALEAYVLSL